MGSPSIPAAPAAPDYAAANREGITTDISTLATRRKIENAAAAGSKVTYTDPTNGQEVTADFTGLGEGERAARAAQILGQQNMQVQRDQLALRQELGTANARQTAAELRAADPQAAAARAALTARIGDSLGKADYAGYVRDNGDLAAQYENETGQKMTEADPAAVSAWGKRHYDTYGAAEGRQLTRTASGDEIGLDTSAAQLNDRVRALGARAPDGTARLADLYAQAQGLDTSAEDPSTQSLGRALQKAEDDYALGAKLDGDTERNVLNQVRAGQAARGNYLGDAAAVAEATTLGEAGEARRQQRLGNLLDVQNRVFGQTGALRNERRSAQQSRLAQLAGLAGQDFAQEGTTYGNQMNALQMENGLNAQQLGENRATRNENYARQQQQLANASAMVLGNPITNQFGSLAAAANGTVGAPTGVAYNPGTGLNANAGNQAAGFAQQSFGTNSSNWSQQAQQAAQGNPWMSLIGGALGSFAGGGGAALGGKLGGKLF